MKKIKYIKTLILILICLCLFSSCSSPGWFTGNTKIIIGESEKFSREEIEQAIEVAKKEENGTYNATLLSITYDEVMSESKVESYMNDGINKVNPDRAKHIIVLFSDIKTYGDQVVLQPYKVYTGYHWILSREDANSPWTVVNRGFG